MLDAIASARERKTHLVSWLVSHDMASARDIAIAAAQEFGMPLLDLDAVAPDIDTIRLVNDKLLAKHRVLPLVKRGKRLHVAVSDPTNLHAVDEIKFQTGLAIEAVVVEDDKLQRAVQKAIEQVDTQMPAARRATTTSTSRTSTSRTATTRSMRTRRATTSRTRRSSASSTRSCWTRSARARPTSTSSPTRSTTASACASTACCARSRSRRCSSRPSSPRASRSCRGSTSPSGACPQDGRIKMRLSKNRSIDFRVSSCPTLFGEKIVLRILDASTAMMGIDALGYEPFQKELYLKALAKPQGMILVTGPTGSGKTVSLYTGLAILNVEDTNISTAEDPAEIVLAGVNQVNVNPKVGLTFASALRAFLRQDPDVIMVGEIRDLETAEIAIKAAQTGHLVLSTLHTNDAPQTLTRMIDMGVKPYAIATSVSLIIAQRLARRLCSACKQPFDLPHEALLREGFTEQQIATPGFKVYKHVGCGQCTDGYKGRVGLYEVLPVTENIGRIILEGGSAPHIAAEARKNGVWDLRTRGPQKGHGRADDPRRSQPRHS